MLWCKSRGYHCNAWLGKFTVRDVRNSSAQRYSTMLCVIESGTSFAQEPLHSKGKIVMSIADFALKMCQKPRTDGIVEQSLVSLLTLICTMHVLLLLMQKHKTRMFTSWGIRHNMYGALYLILMCTPSSSHCKTLDTRFLISQSYVNAKTGLKLQIQRNISANQW